MAESKRELEHTQGQLDEARVEDARAKQQRERTLATGENASARKSASDLPSLIPDRMQSLTTHI